MGRFLITTADERTWKFDRPVLFLGEWCRLYDRKHVWERMNATVAEPYGLQPGEKQRDLAYCQGIYQELLDELTVALNAFHGTRHGRRYWTIVLGHWLRRYVETAFNRYSTLDQALKTHEISGTAVLVSGNDNLAAVDSLAYIWASNDDVWNHVLNVKLLRFLGRDDLATETVPLDGVTHLAQGNHRAAPVRQTAKRLMLNAASSMLSVFSRAGDATIIGSYLPLEQELVLQASLGQCPQIWRSPELKVGVPCQERRRAFEVNASRHSGFERCVRLLLGDVIPICYLEGYGQLVQQAEALPWPARPRFIFTASNFDTDEIFKVWCGTKSEQGAPYFAGQHGNNYGTHFCAGNPDWPEREASDRFFSWGWTDASPNVVPAFTFKTTGSPSKRFDPDGGLLLIEECINHRITPWDGYCEFGIYQEAQFRFVAALSDTARRQLTVRLHAGHRDFRWCDEERWRDRALGARVEPGTAPIQALTAESRLVVHSYDSTGILETLALNVPTVCFWQGALDHLLPDATPFYELLRSVDILLDGPEQAAEMISSRWTSIVEWWNSPQVQSARQVFCDRYSRTTDTPIHTMKQLLLTYAAQGER